MDPIYLDNSATTRPDPRVLEAMLPYFRDMYANPSSVHMPGQRARAGMEEARRAVARLIGCPADGVVFTSGGTEAINLAILGVVRSGRRQGRHLVTSAIEHPATGRTMDYLESQGYTVSRLPVDANGVIAAGSLARVLRPDTLLVSIMHASNEVGTIQPIAEMAAVVRPLGIPFHVDAVQTVGKIPVDLTTLGVDLLSFSSHKLHGPKGVGALCFRPGTPLAPQMYGGHQELGRRPGTENVPGIAGLGAACRLAGELLPEFAARVGGLRDSFESEITRRVPDIVIHARPVPRAPHISKIGFAGVDGEAVIISLDILGVAASSGSACSSGALEPSPTLRAMRCPPAVLNGSVRFSLSRETTAEEIVRASAIIAEAVTQIRRLQ